MQIIQAPPLPELNTVNLQNRQKSNYWVFVIMFLGIVACSILGLFGISAYERREQARIDRILDDTEATKFIPVINQE